MTLTELGTRLDKLDRKDPLREFRERFFLPTGPDGQELVYLCGNSLGLQPRTVATLINQELEDWKSLGVEGHFHARRPWMPYHELLTAQMADVVGALPMEIVCMNSLTVNLHLMMVSFYRPTHQRNKILIERGAFPSDRYAVESQILHHGYDPATALLEIEPRSGEDYLRAVDIEMTIRDFGHELALVMLPGVQYYTGQVFDIERINRAARAAGCAIGWDLAHAVGNVPLQLHQSQADFAVWCNYKYMNAGPGAIGGCFIHERHAANPDIPRFAGWWGHDKGSRFTMPADFVPIASAEGWQLSNPPVLAMTPLLASLDIFSDAGIDRIREKSLRMGRILIEQLQQNFAGKVQIMTPLGEKDRGAQLSLRFTKGGPHIQQALIDAGVICDWREPDGVRIAFAPLYNRYIEILYFLNTLERVLNQHG